MMILLRRSMGTMQAVVAFASRYPQENAISGRI
jgi:hypothetical protein